MRAKLKIVTLIVVILISITVILPNTSYAVNSVGEMIQEADSFLGQGKQNASQIVDKNQLKQTSNLVYNVLLAIGTVTAVIWGIVLGIKFITGSVEEQAEIKKSLVPYVVGCIIVFGAFGIWKIVLTIAQTME